MIKILNTQGLGVGGRQNELIELALTFKFQAVEVDMADLVGRHDAMGKPFALQFLQSAKTALGTFPLPVNLGADEATYNAFQEKIPTILELAKELDGHRCYVPIETSSNLAFQENFERHRERLADLADAFNGADVKIGLTLQRQGTQEKDNKFIQTAEELLSLIRAVGHSNVGLCLDTWQWAVGGGGLDQVSELKPEQVTELRLADVSENADPANIKNGDRVLPGDQPQSLSIDIFNQLRKAGYDGSVSIATSSGTFQNRNRDQVISKFSRLLDLLIAGEDIYALAAAERAAAESAAAAEAEASESNEAENVPASADDAAAESKEEATPAANS